MALEFRVIGFGFNPSHGHEQVNVAPVPFSGPVLRAETALHGFISHFSDDDHNFFEHKILTSVDRIEGNRVFVKVTYLLRDKSGNIDDNFGGAVHVLVLADVSSKP